VVWAKAVVVSARRQRERRREGRRFFWCMESFLRGGLGIGQAERDSLGADEFCFELPRKCRD
jgi:hypothetical protein